MKLTAEDSKHIIFFSINVQIIDKTKLSWRTKMVFLSAILVASFLLFVVSLVSEKNAAEASIC